MRGTLMANDGGPGGVDLLERVDDLRSAGPEQAPSVDLLRLYLDDAGRYALLDHEREADLAKRYRAGQAAAELLAGGLPTRTQRARLGRIARDGERAKQAMVEANLRLVIPLARRYAGRGLDLLELIQEGNLGLLRAVEKFDHAKGYKFSTYGTWWVRQALQRGSTSKGRTIRVPVHVAELHARMRWAEQRLREETGEEPSEAEVAGETNVSVARLREVHAAMQRLMSLDRPVGEEGGATVADVIADPGIVDPAQRAVQGDAARRIAAVLAELDERERRVLVLRFGLDGRQPRTLEQVGRHLGLTRERIRQLQERALSRLRDPALADQLAGLLAVYAPPGP